MMKKIKTGKKFAAVAAAALAALTMTVCVGFTASATDTVGANQLTVMADSDTVQKSVKDLNISLSQSTYTFNRKAKTPSVTIKSDDYTLTKGTDFTVSYSSNVNAGTGNVTITGIGNYTGTVTKNITIQKYSVNGSAVKKSVSNAVYTGKKVYKYPTLTYMGKKLVRNTDYTLKWSSNTSVGTAKVTITGKGNFSGTKTLSYKINPKKVGTLKASSTSSTVTLKWSGVKNCTGYRIYRYASGKRTLIHVSAYKTRSYTVKKLSSGKSYTYQIVSYKDASKKRYYSALTAVTIKTKSASTPVGQHGRLSVKGKNIIDQNGKVFRLKGMSTHGIMWENFSDILTKTSLKVLRDDWKCNAIRIAMYTEEYGGYTTSSSFASQAKAKVENGVANATALGMYAIIDWHILSDGNPNTHKSQAISFFTAMAKKYKNQNNIIYEICNEPNGNGVSWAGGIKSYCQTLVNTIRKYDKKAIIVCGTGTWSQDIDQVLGNRLSDKNCVYALHFYADTHREWLRERVKKCNDSGLPILVTEFGTCDASGNNNFNSTQTTAWIKLLKSLNIGYFNWSACGKQETASAFKSGTNLTAIKAGTSQLTQSGKLIRSLYRAY